LYAPSQDNRFPPKTPLALHALIPLLPPLHAKFFELLDSELEKIDSFYAEREKEMRDRSEQLKEQLNELGLHRQKYYVSARQPYAPLFSGSC
jgi:xenotropic and polytropic retrovirus receptor 1